MYSDLYNGTCRAIWEASGKALSWGGGFSIVQAEDYPDDLVLDAQDEYRQLMSREEAERLIRNLRAWLDHGKETVPHECDCHWESGAVDEENIESVIRDAVVKAAEESDVEKVLRASDVRMGGERYWTFYVVWGREIVYTDMMRFLETCDLFGRRAYFYSAEEMGEIETYGNAVVETIYERPESERRDLSHRPFNSSHSPPSPSGNRSSP